MANRINLCSDEYIRWKGPDGAIYGLLCEVDPDADAKNPRKNDNLSIMACYHDRYAMGDSLTGVDLEEKLDRVIRDNMEDEAIFQAIKSGKVPGIDIEPDGEGLWNVYETYAIETPLGESNTTRELVYEGVCAHGIYETICDDISLAQFVAILSTEAVVAPLLFTECGAQCHLTVGDADDLRDSRCVGVAVVFRQSIIEGWGEMTEEEWREQADQVLTNEVEEYNRYLNGETYIYTLHRLDSDDPGEALFFCSGLGMDIIDNGAAEYVNDEADADTGLMDAINAGEYTEGRVSYHHTPVFM